MNKLTLDNEFFTFVIRDSFVSYISMSSGEIIKIQDGDSGETIDYVNFIRRVTKCLKTNCEPIPEKQFLVQLYDSLIGIINALTEYDKAVSEAEHNTVNKEPDPVYYNVVGRSYPSFGARGGFTSLEGAERYIEDILKDVYYDNHYVTMTDQNGEILDTWDE